ncbi:unnamed protein product [Thlaspi arvense]|uniref:RING-type domain-containing protein n=1 Tax=Thlaspi arvense TaxID=13288 RepID=A0AAU9S5M6_THLAR|nr:unnamed protein product [Thlaspi arvense]
MPNMDSPRLTYAPAGFSMGSPNPSSSLTSDSEEDDVSHGTVRRFNNRSSGNFNRAGFPARLDTSALAELNISFFAMPLTLCFVLFGSVATMMIMGYYRPHHVLMGPSSSLLMEPSPIFVQSVKVKDLDDSKSGLELFGFYKTPSLDAVVNWSESRSVSVPHRSFKAWPFYLNEGASLNISYTVKPEDRPVRLVVKQGKASESLLQEPVYDTALSWNVVRGSGKVEVKISSSSSYYVAVANSKLKDIEVELDIAVRAVLYDSKDPFYKCTFSNGECTFDAMSLSGTSIVLTSPVPKQGAPVEDGEWFIQLSYQPRWMAYVIITGFLCCFALLVIQLMNWLWLKLERALTDNDSPRRPLLANKDDDGSSMGSSNESFVDDADLEDLSGNGVEDCIMCFEARRDCFFLPCGHCVTCYECGTMIEDVTGVCPMCRKKIKKVKRIYTV